MSTPRRQPGDHPLLSVRDLSVSFGRAHDPVVSGVSFEIGPIQRVGLIGESGSGKSLTALAIMGLLPDSAQVSGSITVAGDQVIGRPDAQLARWRGDRMAMVFQEPMTALDPTMKTGRQVAEVLRLHQGAAAGHARERVVEMLGVVELADPERIANSYPFELSGGQRQRVVVAMAMINSPDLLICDEPTTALDVTVQSKVLQVLDTALTRQQTACLFISHDLAVVAQVCSHVLVMLDGELVDSGSVADVLAAPQHPYTAGLVATSRLDQVEPGTRLPVLSDFVEVSGRER